MDGKRLRSRTSLDAIRRLAEGLSDVPTAAAAARLAAGCARDLLQLDTVTVYVRDRSGRLALLARAGSIPARRQAALQRRAAQRCAGAGAGEIGASEGVVVVPIRAAGQVVGALVGAGGRASSNGRPHAALAAIAALTATALGPTVLNHEARARAGAFQALHGVAVTAGTIRDARQLARLSIEEAQDLLHVDSATLRWWDPEAGGLRLLAGNDSRSRHRPELVAPGDGVIGAAFKRQRLVIEQDYAHARNVLPESLSSGTRAAMGVPLRVHDRCVGAMSVNHYSPRRFTEHEGQILSMLAAQVAPAIEAALLAEQEKLRASTLSSLYEVAVAATGVLDQSLLARLVADKACSLLAADSAALVVWDESAEVLRVVADNQPGRGPSVRKPGEGCMGLAFQRREAVAVDDYKRWEGRIEWPEGRGARSALAVPLLIEDRALGSLGIRCSEIRHFEPDEVQLLSLLAAQVAPALQAARLFSELQSSQAQLSHVLSHTPVVLFALDRQGRITLAHGQASIAYGLSGNSYLGRSVFDLIDDSSLRGAFRRALAGEHANALVQMQGADFDLRCSPLFDAVGRPDGVIAVAVDVSERRRAEEARRESEAKSRFLATMSHELRTPLNSVLGYGQLLSSQTFGPLNERQARYLDHIQSSGRHLLELIDDVLDISKIQAGHLQVSLEDFDVEPVLESAAIKIRPMLGDKNLKLEVLGAPGLRVRADRRRLEQVLLNLLTNAVKFTPAEGRISLSGRTRGDRVEVRVEDTGPGIAPADLERIFQEFIQLDSGFARAQPGSGIGLALCRRLVELMEGRISVESRLGHGSVFKVDLPAGRPSRSRRHRVRIPVPDSA